MVKFLSWCLLKDMLISSTTFCMQWQNGFSGFTPVDGLMFSLYDVAMTTIFMTVSSIFDHDLSYSADEKSLPYSMSSLFIFSRKNQSRKKFLLNAFLMNIYALICGVVIFYVYYFGQSRGILNHRGYQID